MFALDTYHNAGDPTVPYLAIGRGETALFGKPWFNVTKSIPAVVSSSMAISHDYTVSIVQGQVTATIDGVGFLGNDYPSAGRLFLHHRFHRRVLRRHGCE